MDASTEDGTMNQNWLCRRVLARTLVAVVTVLGAAGCGASGKTPTGSSSTAAARTTISSVAATAKVIAFDRTATRPARRYRIAYLAECTSNPYCQARLRGVQAAAKKYGFQFQIFDAEFSPQTQLQRVQDAVSQGFDGYLFAPTAGVPGCTMWKRYLQPTGKPVVTLDLPMCNDAGYTPGVGATVTMASQAFFNTDVDYAFRSCTRACQVAAIGGPAGSDLFNTWERAIAQGEAKYPNVKVVTNQPGNFDPQVALRVVGDALRAHPGISVVISPWDDMTRGAEQAIVAAGKRPGKDVRIYSTGATKVGIQRVEHGVWNETMVFLPFQESYYAAVALIMALEGKPVDGYVNEADMPQVTRLGSLFVTKANAARFHPNY
jgi:ribose transport system substrate-binding protein